MQKETTKFNGRRLLLIGDRELSKRYIFRELCQETVLQALNSLYLATDARLIVHFKPKYDSPLLTGYIKKFGTSSIKWSQPCSQKVKRLSPPSITPQGLITSS